MFSRKIIATILVHASFLHPVAIAQPYPPPLPPVEIPIQNIPQETPLWCWAAVAQQIILASNWPQETPPQCALVAAANNMPTEMCCRAKSACVMTGSFPQIQKLIAQFSGRTSSYALPTDPMTLYNTIASGHAVIVQLRTGLQSTHVVVIRGMSFMYTQMGVQPVLHINDPMALYTQPVLFSEIEPIWMDAIVVN